MDRVPVESSTLASVGYDATNLMLELEFRSGEVYQYSAVPHRFYRELLDAESKGSFFNRHIRPRFPHVHLAPATRVGKTI